MESNWIVTGVVLLLLLIAICVYLLPQVRKAEDTEKANCLMFVKNLVAYLRERGFFELTAPENKMHRLDLAGNFYVCARTYDIVMAALEREGLTVTQLEHVLDPESKEHNHKIQCFNNYVTFYLEVTPPDPADIPAY